ncbi:MAG: prolyl oligopeptidase family serine peptidase [Daejeonella sp.]
MYLKYLPKVLLAALLLLTGSLNAQEAKRQATDKKEKYSRIVPYFAPPAEFAGVYGKFRSPLKFYNNDTVKTAARWKLRREEILERWHSLMGKWPPLITDQKMEVLESVEKEGYTQHHIRFRWTPNEKTTAYLLVPHAKGRKPAVVTTFYEPESALGLLRPDRDFAYQLAKRGFVTLSIGTTETSKSKDYSIYYPSIDKAEVQPLSMLAYAAANAWHLLAKVPDVDSTRIGIMGHSYGGKWAMFASCLFDKYAAAVWSDPGIVFDTRESVNYWEPWYLGYHTKPWRKRGLITETNPAKGLYLKLLAEGYDLHELHALMAPRPFLVSGGSEDPVHRWVPLNHTIKVNKLLGFKNRVAMTNRPEHSPNTESNEQAYSFLEYFLKK